MIEILFIATTIYVAYVFYNVVNEAKPQTDSQPNIAEKKPTETTPASVAVEVSEPIQVQTPATVANEAEIDTTVAANQINTLRNPITGEISKINVSYSFTKRWIKEALVSEGLLDKIYTNNELNAEINAKIKQALATLKTLPNYQV
jgi:hypothetical protein